MIFAFEPVTQCFKFYQKYTFAKNYFPIRAKGAQKYG